MCAVLDRLAHGPNFEHNARPPNSQGIHSRQLLSAWIRFFTTSNTSQISSGGLIGLDRIHLAEARYRLVAKEFTDVMAHAGVHFANGS
jgi:hypothetical protein